MYQIKPGMSTSPGRGFAPFWPAEAALFGQLSYFSRNKGDLDSSPKAATYSRRTTHKNGVQITIREDST
jgi:hypothetical protein